ncbi:sensitivity to high expression protein she9 [Vermiconidia calcicola]|uniref:Sensitivity to high expression protein she9 n=1 Tax=Vermiconidia calcicola TaxID=1690605 RepID=A0ACC3MB37_9PEZI|nr:sensitivity to high expression protein she9 [Vermiconidia calcicola]
MAHLMDQMLARASVASQHINNYTGTDYSGIEALKTQIVEQEQKVRASHKLVDSTRKTHHEAHARQGSSQKEIVSLLERKSSWSPTDLERYMSLVRSEHANESAVQAANDGLAAAERDLEDSRSLLERLERKQYHEEQIWSDTIRRNSTWVTFGLMGVNIILLLANIGIFEPYRRRKIVKEVKKALDEKTLVSPEVERQVDEVIEPAGIAIEAIEQPAEPSSALPAAATAVPPNADLGTTPLAAGELLPEETVETPEPSLLPQPQPVHPKTWTGMREAYVEAFQDLFSERVVQLKRVDVTTTALQGAATGFAVMGLLFVVFRPR